MPWWISRRESLSDRRPPARSTRWDSATLNGSTRATTPGQPHRGEGTEGKEPAGPRHPCRQSAEVLDAAGPRACRYDADEDEKEGGVEPVCDLLEDGSVQADCVPRGGTEQDEAQSPYGGVGDERLEVGLQEGHESSVDDVDDP